MKVKSFTGGEMDALRRNPYTYKVTQCHLSFTVEFKELFWKHYNEWMTPKDILISLGYDPDILGENPCEWYQDAYKGRNSRNRTGSTMAANHAVNVPKLLPMILWTRLTRSGS